jgi:1-acyl-sn-glycerol-3-phosphate acyltransferase
MSAVFAGAPVLPEERLWVWRIGYPPVRALASLLAPWRIEGADRVPARGPFVVVTNHVNWKDPPWIEFALGRAIRYMAKREVFAVPVMGFVLRGIGCFPVRRGEADRGALGTALAVLAAGQPLGYFPEGHRSESGALIRAKPGIALIAERSEALIVPVGVIGTKEARLGRFWRRDITIRVGEPFRARDRRDASAGDPQVIADAIMRRIAVLLPTEMRGVYAT